MKRAFVLLAVVALLSASLGCVGITFAPVMPPPAFLVTMHTAPISASFHGGPAHTRKGSASCTNILGIVSLGDCGIGAAVKDGSLKTVSYADYTVTNILFLFNVTTVTVYGQ